jgi:hypothetical protein
MRPVSASNNKKALLATAADDDSDADEGVGSGCASDQGDSDSCETGDQLLHSYLYHRYVHVRDRALTERSSLGRGQSPLMRSLYNFWVERLQHKFNRNMFANFKELALEDAMSGDRYGEFLFRSLSLSLFLKTFILLHFSLLTPS